MMVRILVEQSVRGAQVLLLDEEVVRSQSIP